MEESAPLERAMAAAATTSARRMRSATAKRAAANALRPRDMSAPAVPPMVTAAAAAPGTRPPSSTEAAAVALRTSATAAAGPASLAASAARMRSFGRLKSFSSRQRMAPGMQRPASAGAAAGVSHAPPSAATTTKNTQNRRWSERQAPADQSAPAEASVERSAMAVTSRSNTRHQGADDEETKESESHSAALRSPQLEQTRPLQRMQCVQLKCTALPELVLPYLYGDRKSRINTIMHDTGCTIDYCPMSPGDEAQSPQTKAYIMNFLLSAETASSLDEAIRLLRALVEKVEAHLLKKRRIRSLHTTSSAAFRPHDAERSSGAQSSDDSQESTQYSVEYGASTAKTDASSSSAAQHVDRELPPQARHPISPVALETPLDAYRQRHHTSVRRRTDDVHHYISHHERMTRLAVPYDDDDDDMVLYDRWGRPVFCHDRSVVDASAFERAPGGDASAEVGDRSEHQSVPVRAPRRRHWSYSDESEWRAPSRGFAHVSPSATNERATSPSSSARRMLAPIRRRYAPYPYHYSEMVYADADADDRDTFESDRRSRVDAHAPAAAMQSDERYSDFESEDLLEREEDLLAAQEYAIASSARAHALYAVRRSDARRLAHVRDVSPPRFTGKRAASSRASAHYAREYFDGDWLSEDDDDDDVVYRRYARRAAPASSYPPPSSHLYVHASSTSRRRYNSYPSPSGRQHHHARAARPESPGAGQSKRRKTLAVVQSSDFPRHDHSDSATFAFETQQRSSERDEHDGVVLHDPPVHRGESRLLLLRRSEMSSPDNAPDGIAINEQQPPRTDSGLEPSARATNSADPASHAATDDALDRPDRNNAHSGTGERAEDDAVLLKSVLDHDEPMLDAQQQLSDEKAHELQEGDVVSGLGASAVLVAEHRSSAIPMPDASVNAHGTASAACAGELAPTDPEHIDSAGTVIKVAPHASAAVSPQSVLGSASSRELAPAHDDALAAAAPANAIVPGTQPAASQRSNWRVRANEVLATSLERDSAIDAEFVEAQREAKAQLKRYVALETKRKVLAQLDALSTAAYELQCLVVSANCSLDLPVRREMLRVLDDAVQASVRAASTPTEKLASLRTGIEQALALANVDAPTAVELSVRDPQDCSSSLNDAVISPVVSPKTGATAPAPTTNSVAPPLPAVTDSSSSTAATTNWDDGTEWFETADDPFGIEPVEPGAQVESKATSIASLALKSTIADDGSVAAARESSSLYPSTLFSAISACSPTSFVMKGMQKRLFGDIARANAYYYLRTGEAHDDSATNDPTTPVARPPCEFGCATSATAVAVQKVVAQISSRMKWFDEITYALARARSSGADVVSECLNRKKMNSTIRKLHLMAIQLHCLVSHMYCVRGHVTCTEQGSLHAALTSSFFEKRMIAYKAKLKLDSDLHGAPDELLRDTFEFFPEFLLCIEMWGYDYRECSTTTASSSGATSASHGDASKIRTGGKALPLAFFARVESAVLDYEADANGYLHTICEELLTIVCLWNDFVWGDNLHRLSLERIATFEAEMKKSSAKILQTYALHLMGSWAIRLMANPDELQSLRFTQQNAYYAERSKMRGLASSSAFASASTPSAYATVSSSSSSGVSGKPPSDGDHIDDDDRETVSAYWKQKLDDGELDKREALAAPLCPESIERWSKAAASAHLLKWSRVFQLRGELETCGVVLSDFVSDIVRSTASPGNDEDDGDASSAIDAMALLELFAKARVLGTDVAKTCETIALHSASTQLPQVATSHASSDASAKPVEPPGAAESTPGATASDDATVRPTSVCNDSTLSSPTEPPSAAAALPQPDVKDLVQILASTRKEVDEIFCARTRSGRTRKKLQAQSVQLAQQTLELLHTIATLRTS